ncbi:MAG: hypothetical protein KF749_09765 [Bacteroidetes bacterium]|nr:hypothetical protein [Bacteroidota bacterium]
MKGFDDTTRVVVEREKLSAYLLSETHSSGSAKARLFKAIGYTIDNQASLRDQLVSLARFGEIVQEQESKFGTKYVIDGAIATPAGQTSYIRTVWIRNRGSNVVRLVTAYPMRRKK